MRSDLIAAIAAGGAARRMGRDKALVRLDGTPLIDHVVATVGRLTDRILVVGRSESPPGTEAVPDDRPARRGPLAGLATALRLGEGRRVLFVAVDQPLLRRETLERLAGLEEDRAVVPIDRGVRQITCAVYPGVLDGEAAAELEAGGSVQSLLDRIAFRPVEQIEWELWGEDGRSWFSVDTVEDLEHAEGLRAGEH